MRKLTIYIVSAIVASTVASSVAGCASSGRGSAGGEVTGVGGTAWAEPTPYVMVLV